MAGHVLGVDRLESLHRTHATVVRAYALRRSDAATADDVCAEVWTVAWRRLNDIPEDALPWLLGVARRVLANHRRGQRRSAALRDRIAAVSPPNAHIPPPDLPADPALARALAALRPSDREALLLIAWEGLSSARAAVALGVRPGTFAVRLHRARRRLADALDAEKDARAVEAMNRRPQESMP